MNQASLVQKIRNEQLKNPLQRYRKVREFYAGVINKNCIFYNLHSLQIEKKQGVSETFPKSLFPKYGQGRGLIENLLSPQYDKILPISFELVIDICGKYEIAERNIENGFCWDHFYAVCPSIRNPLSTIKELDEASDEEWINLTPEWWHKTVAELNDHRNL